MKVQRLKALFCVSALWTLVAVFVGNTSWIKPVQPRPLALKEFDRFWLEYALWNLPFFLLVLTGLLALRSTMRISRLRQADGASVAGCVTVSDRRILWVSIATAFLTIVFLVYSWFFGLVSKQM